MAVHLLVVGGAFNQEADRGERTDDTQGWDKNITEERLLPVHDDLIAGANRHGRQSLVRSAQIDSELLGSSRGGVAEDMDVIAAGKLRGATGPGHRDSESSPGWNGEDLGPGNLAGNGDANQRLHHELRV